MYTIAAIYYAEVEALPWAADAAALSAFAFAAIRRFLRPPLPVSRIPLTALSNAFFTSRSKASGKAPDFVKAAKKSTNHIFIYKTKEKLNYQWHRYCAH